MMRFAALVCSLAVLFPAQSFAAGASKDEKNLDKEIARLSRTAAEPRGEQAVVTRIAAVFKTAPEHVRGLHDRGLGYGETATILSIARRMAGGITDQNIDRIIAFRKGPPAAGWGAVAKQFGVKLGVTVSQIKRITNESHRAIKQDELRSRVTATDGAPARPAGRPDRKFTGEGRSLPQGHAAD